MKLKVTNGANAPHVHPSIIAKAGYEILMRGKTQGEQNPRCGWPPIA